MTNPEQPAGPAHPARAAGYALIGVAVIALVIGLVSLFTGGPDDDPPAAQSTPPSSTSAPSGTSGSSETPGTTSAPGETTASTASTAPPSSETSPPAGTATAPPTTTANPGASTANVPPPPVDTTPKPAVRIYNNSTTQGLAGRASDDVVRAGWQVAEKGNYSQGTIPTTTVYFRPGTDEETSARELARILNAEVKPRFDGIQSAQPGIIVIVTNDYKGPTGKVS